MAVENLAPLLPRIKSGRLRVLAVASPRRSSLLPDVPTMAEVGVPGVESSLDYALLAPAGTPAEVIAVLNRETNAVLQELLNIDKPDNGPAAASAAATRRSFGSAWPSDSGNN